MSAKIAEVSSHTFDYIIVGESIFLSRATSLTLEQPQVEVYVINTAPLAP